MKISVLKIIRNLILETLNRPSSSYSCAPYHDTALSLQLVFATSLYVGVDMWGITVHDGTPLKRRLLTYHETFDNEQNLM